MQSTINAGRVKPWQIIAVSSPVFCLSPILASLIAEVWFSPLQIVFYDILIRVSIPMLTLSMLFGKGLHPRDFGFPARIRGELSIAQFIQCALWSSLALMSYGTFSTFVWTYLGKPADLSSQYSLGAVPPAVTLISCLLVDSFFVEVLYRGVLGAALLIDISAPRPERQLSCITYIVASGLLTGIAHAQGDLPVFLAAAYFGIIASIVFVFFRNIWLCVIGHFVVDFAIAIGRYVKHGVL